MAISGRRTPCDRETRRKKKDRQTPQEVKVLAKYRYHPVVPGAVVPFVNFWDLYKGVRILTI